MVSAIRYRWSFITGTKYAPVEQWRNCENHNMHNWNLWRCYSKVRWQKAYNSTTTQIPLTVLNVTTVLSLFSYMNQLILATMEPSASFWPILQLRHSSTGAANIIICNTRFITCYPWSQNRGQKFNASMILSPVSVRVPSQWPSVPPLPSVTSDSLW